MPLFPSRGFSSPSQSPAPSAWFSAFIPPGKPPPWTPSKPSVTNNPPAIGNWKLTANNWPLTTVLLHYPVMPHVLAQAVEILTTALAIASMGYFLAAMVAAQAFLAARRTPLPVFAPGVTILKSLKGLDPGMIDAFRSHCRQAYAGEFELLFGVSSLADPAVFAVEQLKLEFPSRSIQLIECPLRLGTNGKVSTL